MQSTADPAPISGASWGTGRGTSSVTMPPSSSFCFGRQPGAGPDSWGCPASTACACAAPTGAPGGAARRRSRREARRWRPGRAVRSGERQGGLAAMRMSGIALQCVGTGRAFERWQGTVLEAGWGLCQRAVLRAALCCAAPACCDLLAVWCPADGQRAHGRPGLHAVAAPAQRDQRGDCGGPGVPGARAAACHERWHPSALLLGWERQRLQALDVRGAPAWHVTHLCPAGDVQAAEGVRDPHCVQACELTGLTAAWLRRCLRACGTTSCAGLRAYRLHCRLAAQVFEGVRDHIVQACELKFHCFFLMPVIDAFPAVLRCVCSQPRQLLAHHRCGRLPGSARGRVWLPGGGEGFVCCSGAAQQRRWGACSTG